MAFFQAKKGRAARLLPPHGAPSSPQGLALREVGPGIIWGEKSLGEAEPQVGFAPSHLISGLERGTEGRETGLPLGCQRGMFGKPHPVFSQRWPLS